MSPRQRPTLPDLSLQHPATFKLSSQDPAATPRVKDKEQGAAALSATLAELWKLQAKLYADGRYALLLVLQGMDGAGKDSLIQHVMSGVNPQGCRVVSFKAPTETELKHDFLWRCARELPGRGEIGIFNRSYYEEVVAVRVHPEWLERQHLPQPRARQRLWEARLTQINAFEHYLTQNGIVVVKCFLHISRAEQKRRLLDRIERPEKNWKMRAEDVTERSHWDEFQKAYQAAFRRTHTDWAPWHILPADHKWYARLAAAQILVKTLKDLDLQYPRPTAGQRHDLSQARRRLLAE